MNWVWPMAPAHEPSILGAGMAPSATMRMAANSSALKKSARRGSQARVARLSITLKPPVNWP